MKKQIVLLCFTLCITHSTSFAQFPAQSNTENINPKNDIDQNVVTVNEFNLILGTLRKVYNVVKDNLVQIGINEPQPAENLTLDVGGRVGATEFCDEDGFNCINPKEWNIQPSIKLEEPAGNCEIRYRTKDQRHESDWVQTGGNDDPNGLWGIFYSEKRNNCAGDGCGIQMGLRCRPNPEILQQSECRIRYRINYTNQENQEITSDWKETPYTTSTNWEEGPWASVIGKSWGKGISVQASIECLSPKLQCQMGYRLRNEELTGSWVYSRPTSGKGWSSAQPAIITGENTRLCDSQTGCGMQMHMKCLGKQLGLKRAIYNCPIKTTGGCPSQCNGQLSLKAQCLYQALDSSNQCTINKTEVCEKVGNLIE